MEGEKERKGAPRARAFFDLVFLYAVAKIIIISIDVFARFEGSTN